ncbi:nucleoside recognition domain-containing protein [Frisingicoccus sp.]|uniref:nucleoside recognition domain-containing protein n=1 Tax=Frisingicoccus sp. TaxID=1918627 RepID=UPI003AB2FA3F
MSNTTENNAAEVAAVKKKKVNPINSFVAGARNGFSMSMNNMLPNVLFAFALIKILNLSGLTDLIGSVFGPVMAIFGLPGIASTAIIAGILSTGGGLGAAASLALNGDINASQVAILLVGIVMFGSLVQYVGRVLGAADVDTKHYPMLIAIDLLNSFLAMFVTSFIVGR